MKTFNGKSVGKDDFNNNKKSQDFYVKRKKRQTLQDQLEIFRNDPEKLKLFNSAVEDHNNQLIKFNVKSETSLQSPVSDGSDDNLDRASDHSKQSR